MTDPMHTGTPILDDKELNSALLPSYFIDSDNAAVRAFAEGIAGTGEGDIERGVRLYYTVRDLIRYDPYDINCTPEGFRASTCLERGRGFCITKAALLAASARAVGIASRVGFGDVRNHLATPRLIEFMGTDEFVFHGYTELFLDGRWVKATPAFNLSLCDRFGVLPLEFDGREDSLFHPYDAAGRRHMEYVRQRGSYDEVPFDEIMAAFRKFYPRAMRQGFQVQDANFEIEAGQASKSNEEEKLTEQ